MSPVEAIKSEIELKSNRQALQTMKRRVERSRKNLASFWGSAEPDFDRVATLPEELPLLPSMGVLAAALWDSPDIKRYDSEKKYQAARFDLARAERIPDPTVAGGYRQVPETDDHAFILEISLPLKLFDRNQGNIESARLAVNQVDDRRSAAVNARQRTLDSAFQDALAARDAVIALQQEIIPATRKVFSAQQEGYRSGKFTYLELLDAQRVLVQSETQYNDAISAYYLAVAGIERLIGAPVDQVPVAGSSNETAVNIKNRETVRHEEE